MTGQKKTRAMWIRHRIAQIINRAIHTLIISKQKNPYFEQILSFCNRVQSSVLLQTHCKQKFIFLNWTYRLEEVLEYLYVLGTYVCSQCTMMLATKRWFLRTNANARVVVLVELLLLLFFRCNPTSHFMALGICNDFYWFQLQHI